MSAFLEELLRPLSLQTFHDEVLFKAPYAGSGDPSRFAPFLCWEIMEEIFHSGHSDCWLAQSGKLFENSVTLDYKSARLGFEKGQTLLVRHAEKAHPVLEKLALDFYESFRDPVDIQIYCTPAGQKGFGWHYDAEDVFVLQVSGEKEFWLRKNTVNPWPLVDQLPANMYFEHEVSVAQLRCRLCPGDWLYIPVGYWHRAEAASDSFHLSVGITAASAFDYLQDLLPRLSKNLLWRQRLPARGNLNTHSDDEKLAEYQKIIHQLGRSLAAELEDESSLRSYIDSRRRL
jgi:50S ribosomal protein L16 3-hydroxylase